MDDGSDLFIVPLADKKDTENMWNSTVRLNYLHMGRVCGN